MFFLSILLAFFVYVLIATFVIRLVRKAFSTRMGKNVSTAVLFVIAVLIPTADHIIGYRVFQSECEKIGGGVEILRTVEGVEGFLDQSRTWSNSVSELRKLGYRYVESELSPGKYVHFSASAEGAGVESWAESAISRYAVSSNLPGRDLGWGITLTRFTIEDRQERAVIASKTGMSYRGGWMTQSLGGGDYGRCGSGRDLGLYEFVLRVLGPIRSE